MLISRLFILIILSSPFASRAAESAHQGDPHYSRTYYETFEQFQSMLTSALNSLTDEDLIFYQSVKGETCKAAFYDREVSVGFIPEVVETLIGEAYDQYVIIRCGGSNMFEIVLKPERKHDQSERDLILDYSAALLSEAVSGNTRLKINYSKSGEQRQRITFWQKSYDRSISFQVL